jgi:hypothetical protein
MNRQQEILELSKDLDKFVEDAYRFFYENEPSDETKFEVMVYTDFHLLHLFNYHFPNDYEQFSYILFSNLECWAANYGISYDLEGEIIDFINGRLNIYHKEVIGMKKTPPEIPINILRNLFIEPMQVEEKKCDNFIEWMPKFIEYSFSDKNMYHKLEELIDSLKKSLTI